MMKLFLSGLLFAHCLAATVAVHSRAAAAVSVLPGGGLAVAAPGGGSYILRSVFTHQNPPWSGAHGPTAHTLGTSSSNTSSWSVTIDSSRAADGVWAVAAVAGAFSIHRTVSLTSTSTRININDTITASATHPSLQELPVGTLLGLQTQHILQFPTGSNVTEALVPGARYRSGGGGACNSASNVDEFGMVASVSCDSLSDTHRIYARYLTGRRSR
jgi:hypothetical protein